MSVRFIVNPVSGPERNRSRVLEAVRMHAQRHARDGDICVTREPGHATHLAREAVLRGYGTVVAVGGDGTMNEVATALVHTSTSLAIVPVGSGNGLALHLRIPRDPRAALSLATNASSRRLYLDSGEVNGRPFFNVMGFGFDASVSELVNASDQRGLIGYARAAAKALRHRETQTVDVFQHGSHQRLSVALLAIANSDQYGNQARIAPGSRADDGLLDLVAIGDVGIMSAIQLTVRMLAGTLSESAHVRRIRGTNFIVRREADGIAHTDGETHQMHSVLDVRVHPRSLRVIVPERHS